MGGVRKAITEGDVDFLREGLRVLAAAVMEAGVTELTGVPHGERDPQHRLTRRNGCRERRWDTRVGTIGLAIPRVRDGSYFPSLLEPRRRAERALLAVVSEAYVAGVSTRRVEDLVEALGIAGNGTSPLSGGRPARNSACARGRVGDGGARSRVLDPDLVMPGARLTRYSIR